MQSVYSRNDEAAARLRDEMTARKCLVVNVIGAPGVGKTTSLCGIIARLSCPAYVIEGDVEGDADTRLLLSKGIPCVQIRTGGACHLNAEQVQGAMKGLNMREPGILFVENIGNLICPAAFSVGEHVTMVLSNVTEGSDKPAKYPAAFAKADLVLLGKWDLRPHVEFDEQEYFAGVAAAKAWVPVFKTSARTGEGFGEVAKWLAQTKNRLVG